MLYRETRVWNWSIISSLPKVIRQHLSTEIPNCHSVTCMCECVYVFHFSLFILCFSVLIRLFVFVFFIVTDVWAYLSRLYIEIEQFCPLLSFTLKPRIHDTTRCTTGCIVYIRSLTLHSSTIAFCRAVSRCLFVSFLLSYTSCPSIRIRVVFNVW